MTSIQHVPSPCSAARALAALGFGLALVLGACSNSEPADPWSVHETSGRYTLVDPEGNVISSAEVSFDPEEDAPAVEAPAATALAASEQTVKKRQVVVECDICVQNPDTGAWTCFGCHP